MELLPTEYYSRFRGIFGDYMLYGWTLSQSRNPTALQQSWSKSLSCDVLRGGCEI
jgi:hypothetical protein